jgi:uncharacterized Fe-S center protein
MTKSKYEMSSNMTRRKTSESQSNKKTAANVYFVPAYAQYAADRDVLVLETILAHRMYHFLSRFQMHDIVAVKSCENDPVQTSRYAHAFGHLLKKSGQSAFICNTSNRHLDIKSNGIVCVQNALDTHEFCERTVPFVVIDGIYGEHEISRKSDRRLEGDVYLAGELPNLDGLVSVCCFAQSGETNLCGSIVNLGQGLASKKGKIHQRTTSCPQVNVQKCYKCRRCVRACPVNAIAISDGHVVIDARKCIKCGKCVETAHYGGITYDWNATPEHYNEAVARHANGVLTVLEKEVVCVNIIVRDDGDERSFAGAMVSLDPVAVDCASIDFCESKQLLADQYVQRIKSLIDAAQSIGVGTDEYKVETVAY